MAVLGPSLTSRQNPTIKYARSLHQRKHRQRERAFLVEGVRLLRDALAAGATPEMLFVDKQRLGARLDSILSALPTVTRIHPVTPDLLAHLSDTEAPQGAVAIFPFPTLEMSPSDSPLLLLADGIHDPGNLGTLIRSALGAGADAVYLTSDSADPFAPKVVRAGMGAHFRIPIRVARLDRPDGALLACSQRISTTATASVPYDAVDWTHGSTIMIGSEAAGLSSEALEIATGSVAIPLRGGLESLNAAVAGSIVLFEAARQRRLRCGTVSPS